MPQKYRSSPMPLSDEEFERRLRLEERMQQGILLGDGSGGQPSMEYEAVRTVPVYNSGSASAEMPQAAPVTPHRSEGISVADIPRKKKKDDEDEDEDAEQNSPDWEDFEVPPVPETPEWNTPNWSDFMPGGARQGQQGAGHPDTPGTWRINGADHPPLSDEEFERTQEEETRGKKRSTWGDMAQPLPYVIPDEPVDNSDLIAKGPAPYLGESLPKNTLRYTLHEWPDENDSAAYAVGYLPRAVERGNGRDLAHFYNEMPELTGELTDVATKKNVHVTAENRNDSQGNFLLPRQERKGNAYKSESVVPGALDSMGVDYTRASGPPRNPIPPDNPVLRAPSAFGRPVIGLPSSYTIPEALGAAVKNIPESGKKLLADLWAVVSTR